MIKFAKFTNRVISDNSAAVLPRIWRTLSSRIIKVMNYDFIAKVFIGLFVLQFFLLSFWSIVLYRRFSLTYDFATYYQIIWEIWHGHLNPYSTVLGIKAWGNGGQALFWLLAIATFFVRDPIFLLMLQDAAIVGTEITVLYFSMYIVVQHTNSSRLSFWVVFLTGVMLILNPWTYWAASFDIHTETFCAFFAINAMFSLYKGDTKASIIWIILTFSGGLVECTYVAGIGLTVLLSGRPKRYWGIILIVSSVVIFFSIEILGGNKLAPPGIVYGYLVSPNPSASKLEFTQILVGILLHPSRVVRQLWVERANIWSDLSTGGILGLFTPIGIGLPLATILINVLSRAFADVAFQNFPMYGFLTVGTVMVLIWIYRRLSPPMSKIIVVLIGLLLLANSAGWFIVWFPKTKSTWLRVSVSTAATLSKVIAHIPMNSEVIISQGVSGRFAGRRYIHALILNLPTRYRLDTQDVYFVFAPYQGIELVTPNNQISFMEELVQKYHGQILLHESGVWLIRVRRTKFMKSIVLVPGKATIRAWALPGAAGTTVMNGPPNDWYKASNGREGYICAEDYWLLGRGAYLADISLSSSSSVSVQIWNTTSKQLLAQRMIPNTEKETLAIPFTVSRVVSFRDTEGWGPFVVSPIPTPKGNDIEVRIWTQGGTNTRVYSMRISKVRVGV
ncbi:MAG: DUF2079 domain-containing protein [Firmicutes bacterium]|nr:DUF2079 domain-containing protein [Bacillota bacterium]